MNAQKTPTWFKVVGIITLLWNLMGISFFIFDMTRTPEDIAALDPLMQRLYDNPNWVWAAYGLATITGTLGAVMLVMKKKLSHTLFILSLVGVLAQNYYHLIMSEVISDMPSSAYFMPILVISIAIYLVFHTKKGIRAGWLS